MPVTVRDLTDVIAVAAASFTGYALKGDGTVWAWDSGAGGALGNGDPRDVGRPVRVGR